MTHLWEPHAYSDAARADCAWRLDPDWPSPTGDIDTDIAIIGGGYTGLSAALHLAEAGESVTVLEAKSPGWGASGRNGGFCCLGGGMAKDATLTRRHGPSAVGDWLTAQKSAIGLVSDLLARHQIDASRHSHGEVVIAHSPRAFHEFNEEQAHLAAHGIAADILSPEALTERGLHAHGSFGGLHVKIGFALDPGAYAMGLARAAEAAGAAIHANAPVSAIAETAEGFRLTLPQGVVRARRLLIATNGYSAEDVPQWLRARTMPMQSSIIVTRPLSPDEQAAQGWTSDLMAYDSRLLLHYFRRLPDGRFLFGMRGGLNARPATEAHIRTKIRQDFNTMFPAWADVEAPHFWSGLVNFTRSFTPYAGPLPGMKNAWIAMGYHGNGVAMASYSGAIMASLIRGRRPDLPYPDAMQVPLGRFPLGRYRRLLIAASLPLRAALDRR